MTDGPNIARIAALVADPARAEILATLMGGQALTATELTQAAGVTKQTVSAHLSRLVDAQLLVVEQQGRHRYFRLAQADVAELLERLMGIAYRTGAVRLRSGPREPALRRARVCYDHLAGELGVLLFDALQARRLLRNDGDCLLLTPEGEGVFSDFGVDVSALSRDRRVLCRGCLDWSMRRHHLAGALGAATLRRILDLGWARRNTRSRGVSFSPSSEHALRQHFGLAG
jgi:DNA-binding transcriptional ArsR family regulator